MTPEDLPVVGERRRGEAVRMLTAFALLASLSFPQEPDAAPVQDLPRGRIFGSVTDREGKPWVGVVVNLMSRPFDDPDLMGGEELQATTDERGRFRADAVHGWVYHVWAQSEVVDGAYRWTNVVKGRVGSPMRLKQVEQASNIRNVVVKDLEAWKGDGPFTYRIESTSPPMWLTGALDESATFEMPPMPVHSPTVKVLSGRGVVLGTARVHMLKKGPRELKVNQPRMVHLRMYKEGMKDKLDAGGEVVVAEGWHRQVLAKVGKDGRAEFRVPVSSSNRDVSSWSYRVRANGYCAGFMAKPEKAYEDEVAKKFIAADGVVMHGGLADATIVTGRLLLPNGEPMVGAQLLMESEAHGQVEESHYYGGDSRWITRTDAEGRFRGDFFYQNGSGQVRLLLTPEMMSALPKEWQKGLQPWVLLATVPEQKKELKLGDLRIDQHVWPADLFVETHEGLPAGGASIYFDLDGSTSYTRRWFKADRLGRLRVLLPRKGVMRMAVVHDGGVFVERLKVATEDTLEGPVRWPLRLAKPAMLRGNIVDSKGVPVTENAHVSINLNWNSGVERLGDDVAEITLPGVSMTPTELERNAAQNFLGFVLGQSSRSVKADEKGHVEIPVPPFRMVLRVNANYRGENGYLRAEMLQVEMIGEDEEIEMVIPADLSKPEADGDKGKKPKKGQKIG